jgi:hypothetical protein
MSVKIEWMNIWMDPFKTKPYNKILIIVDKSSQGLWPEKLLNFALVVDRTLCQRARSSTGKTKVFSGKVFSGKFKMHGLI